MGHQGKRTRSFGGCFTCRKRRTKCDETKPICNACTKANIHCGGYNKAIVFSPSKENDETDEDGVTTLKIQYRRPLLDESEQKRMCRDIVTAVPPHLTLWHIGNIDEECESLSTCAEIQVNHGPFGAFRLMVEEDMTHKQTEGADTTGEQDSEDGFVAEQDYMVLPEKAQASAREHKPDNTGGEMFSDIDVDDLLGSFLPDTVFIHDSCPSCHDEQLLSWSTETFIEQDDSGLGRCSGPQSATEMGSDECFPSGLNFTQGPIFPDYLCPLSNASNIEKPVLRLPETTKGSAALEQRINTLTTTSIGRSVHHISNSSYSVPEDAITLLQHYTANVVPMLTPYQHSKTPWHIVFVPYCKNTLASLTMGEKVDHASLCSLHGTLAISAISLDSISISGQCPKQKGQDRVGKWLSKAKQHIEIAEAHAQSMLLATYQMPKTKKKKLFKYKAVLVALLTMVHASSAIGNAQRIEFYFGQAETFIRLRGLSKLRKSRKVRLLHHCYAFERAQYESTVHFHDIKSVEEEDHRPAVQCDEAAGNSRSSVHSGESDIDGQMLQVKGTEEGENDLHLEIPGIWPATLYPEIFGLPEIHMSMLWLVTRLAKEKALEVLSLKKFLERAKSLERWIIRLSQGHVDNKACCSHVATSPKEEADQVQRMELLLLPQIILDATCHAMRIYFYRRIYGVDASLLQQDALSVRDCLLRSQQASAGGAAGSFNLAWPAFVAACEARDGSLRAFFAGWFRELQRRSGSQVFSNMLSKVERIWAASSLDWC